MKQLQDFAGGRNVVNDDLVVIQAQLDGLSSLLALGGAYVVSGVVTTLLNSTTANFSAGVVMLNGVLHSFPGAAGVNISVPQYLAANTPTPTDFRPYDLLSLTKAGALEHTAGLFTATQAGENLVFFPSDRQFRRIGNAFRDAITPVGSLLAVGSAVSFDTGIFAGRATGQYRGYVLCDGTNGTPDLRGRTIVGTGTPTDLDVDDAALGYVLGQRGGRNQVRLTADQSGLPQHRHSIPEAGPGTVSRLLPTLTVTDQRAAGTSQETNDVPGLDAKLSHENRMPFHAVNWLMYQGTQFFMQV